MTNEASVVVGGCQLPRPGLAVDEINHEHRRMESPSSKRQQATLDILQVLVDAEGSLQKAAVAVKNRTGLDITPEAIRKALAKKRVGDKLIEVAEALSASPGRPSSSSSVPSRALVYDDPYPNRPPAIELLRGKVDDETIRALLSMSNRVGDDTIEGWMMEGYRLQRLREKPPEPAPPKPIPEPPDVSRKALLERRERLKTRKR